MKALVLMSGGLKSAAIAALLKNNGNEVYGLHFEYGARMMAEESKAVTELGKALQVPIEKANLKSYMDAEGENRPWTIFNKEKPVDSIHPGVEGLLPAMVIMAAPYAERLGAQEVHIGWRAPDAFYPEANANTMNVLSTYYNLVLRTGIKVVSNLLYSDAGKHITIAAKNTIGDRIFRLSTSCYQGHGQTRCGSCRGCRMRATAFKAAGLRDPVLVPDKVEVKAG